MTMTASDLHLCKQCQKKKPADQMRKDSSYASGYRPQCLECKAKKEGPKKARPRKVPFEKRLYPCTRCERDDIPFHEMCKDKRKFAGVASICLACRRKREAELEAARQAEEQEDAKRQAQIQVAGSDWEYCFKCNSQHRPGVMKQPPASIAAGFPEEALLCSKCLQRSTSREDTVRAERAKHGLGQNATHKDLVSAARVAALRQLATENESRYKELVRHFKEQLGVEFEKKWITL